MQQNVLASDSPGCFPTLARTENSTTLFDYCGAEEIEQGFERDTVRPLSMTADDFDEDGTFDLVVGYVESRKGVAALYEGNIDALYLNADGDQQGQTVGVFNPTPFLANVKIFALPSTPSFLGSGDFDADGHLDLVLASAGAQRIFWLSGNGEGAFLRSHSIALPGRLDRLTVGEINRKDGMADVIAAVTGKLGPQLIIFESPHGAFQSEPEMIDLPDPVVDFDLALLDDDPYFDLAIASGTNLIILQGRDRWYVAKTPRSSPQLRRVHLGFQAVRVAFGNFIANRNKTDLALMAEAGSIYLLKNDILSGAKPQIEFMGAHNEPHSCGPASWAVGSRRSSSQKAIAVLPMRLNLDAISDFVVLVSGQVQPKILLSSPGTIYIVNSTNDSDDGACNVAHCSLREAINLSNSNAGADTINFNITGTSPYTISPLSALPAISGPVTIDGTTQTGFTGSPIIELDGSLIGVYSQGLDVTAGTSTIRGLVINRFSGAGILLRQNGGNIVEGNYIGTNVTATTAAGNGNSGVWVRSLNNIIGGTTTTARNIISGNAQEGVYIDTAGPGNGNQITGNYVGTSGTGNAAIANLLGGILVYWSHNVTIGDAVSGAGNLVSGNGGPGIAVQSSDGTFIQGNNVGTDLTGQSAIPNTNEGVSANDSASTNIGGTAGGAGNLISGNGGDGVSISGVLAAANIIQGNIIGLNGAGDSDLGNAYRGITLSGGSGTRLAERPPGRAMSSPEMILTAS